MPTKAEQIIEFGRAVRREQIALAKLASGVVFSTRNVHQALAVRGVLAEEEQAKKGWAMLAKLADYEYPGVRLGAETESAWKGQKRLVRPKEWHAAPTDEEMVAWEKKVLGHRRSVAQAASGVIESRLAQLEDTVAELKKQVADLAQTAHNIGRTA